MFKYIEVTPIIDCWTEVPILGRHDLNKRCDFNDKPHFLFINVAIKKGGAKSATLMVFTNE